MVYLYVADVTQLPERETDLQKYLSKERIQKLEKQKNVNRRKQILGAGLLLEKVLKLYGVSQDNVTIGQNGKPEAEGICFNLSHSGNFVVCAVSDKPVGCDVEKIRKASEKIAERHFCESENIYLKTCDSNKYDEEFFRFWTVKESYLKMTGEGLKVPLREVEVILAEEVKVLRSGMLQQCFIKEYRIPEYQITVCAEEQEFSSLLLMQLH